MNTELTDQQIRDILQRRVRTRGSARASRVRGPYSGLGSVSFNFLTDEDFRLVLGTRLLDPLLSMTPAEIFDAALPKLASSTWRYACRRMKTLWRSALGQQ